MKRLYLILAIGLAAGGLAESSIRAADNPDTDTNAPATEAPAAEPAAESPAATVTSAPEQTTSATETNNIVDPVTGEIKLRMNFRNAPLDEVLKYMSRAAGYIIHPKVDIRGRVTVWSDQPLSKEEAVKLLKQIMNENGYTALEDGRTLTIITSAQARHEDIPVVLGNTPTNIPKNTEIVTQIIPVRSLNAVALIKDLQPLLPADTTITANESGNALVMTDTQANIHRIAEIVRALDSVSSSSSTIIVFPLKFADAKTVAGLIKDLFPTPNASGGGGGGGGLGNLFGRFRGGGGFGGGGGGDGGGSDTGAGHTPSSRVTAVSDDHSNSLVVSAPDDLIPTIKELVTSIDNDVQDLTEVRVFSLKNADPNEMATLLSSLFPDDSKTDPNANTGRFRFGGFFGGQQQQAAASSASSDRMKKMGRVLAVPDQRTGSLVVSASKELMPQIAAMIDRLDDNPRRKQKVFVVSLENAETADVLPVLQDLFPQSTTSRNSSSANSQNNALSTRSQTIQTQQNSQTSPFGSTGTSGGSFGQ